MKNLMWLLPLAFIVGCGDKEEDTGEEVVTEEEAEEETGGAEEGDTGPEEAE